MHFKVSMHVLTKMVCPYFVNLFGYPSFFRQNCCVSFCFLWLFLKKHHSCFPLAEYKQQTFRIAVTLFVVVLCPFSPGERNNENITQYLMILSFSENLQA